MGSNWNLCPVFFIHLSPSIGLFGIFCMHLQFSLTKYLWGLYMQTFVPSHFWDFPSQFTATLAMSHSLLCYLKPTGLWFSTFSVAACLTCTGNLARPNPQTLVKRRMKKCTQTQVFCLARRIEGPGHSDIKDAIKSHSGWGPDKLALAEALTS